jgi:hypothetical protein
MRTICIAFLFATTATANAGDTTRQFYNDKGQNVGSATTNNSGQTTFRNERGQVTGTSTSRNGVTTFRDSMGRQQGTATAPRR